MSCISSGPITQSLSAVGKRGVRAYAVPAQEGLTLVKRGVYSKYWRRLLPSRTYKLQRGKLLFCLKTFKALNPWPLRVASGHVL